MVKIKKLMKSKKGFVITGSILIGTALILFGIPFLGTWLKLMFSKPSAGISPIWIIVIGFVVILLLRRKQ